MDGQKKVKSKYKGMQTFPFIIILLTLSCSEKTLSKVVNSKVFLLVLDGFVHDYQQFTFNMPNFARLGKEGVQGKGLIPPFPSSTWPSMNTLSTGLYPESHGIIDNDFFDDNGVFFTWKGNPSFKDNSKFFSQEPIWLSNQKQKGNISYFVLLI